MSAPAQDVGAALVRLRAGGLSVGLTEAKAAALVAALERGAPAGDAARAAGLGKQLAAVAGAATPGGGAEQDASGDVPAILGGLAQASAAAEAATTKLRSAGSYPLLLAAIVGLSGFYVLGSFGGIALLPGSDAGAPENILTVLFGVTAALVALAAIVLGRVSVPWLSLGWDLVARRLFADSLVVLVGAGAPLPVALRAAARWSGRGPRRAVEAYASALEGGAEPEPAAPLLRPHEARLLAAAAASGTVAEAAAALAADRSVALQRGLSDALVRIQAAGVVLAGVGVAVFAITFYGAYAGVLAG